MQMEAAQLFCTWNIAQIETAENEIMRNDLQRRPFKRKTGVLILLMLRVKGLYLSETISALLQRRREASVHAAGVQLPHFNSTCTDTRT